ncbi:hypothetical protein [Pseudomonas baetica]|uniref:hypothetical protein n=1 Tax=Pseudomonas baetica TaxID=674054 RepID=UPI0021AB7561|nr:hypothetical protein [Pseudomonas baetica]
MNIDVSDFRFREDDEVDLGLWATKAKPLCKTKKAYRKVLQNHVDQLSDQQRLLYASNRYALLLVFQAMHTAGKDGAIGHVMSGVKDADESGWNGRFRSIVDLERHLHVNGTRIVKVFLHLSNDEQRSACWRESTSPTRTGRSARQLIRKQRER